MDRLRPRPKRICMRTGFKVPADEMVEEWTGERVWGPYYDPKHESLDVPPPRGERAKSDATGDEQDRHLEAGEITWDDL